MAERQYLFDTNILSDLIKRPHSSLANRISGLEHDAFCTSIVVACELRYGAVKRGSERLTARVNQLLSRIEVLPLEPEVDQHYAAIRVAWERVGQPIGQNDLFIAAHARVLGLKLITANLREFSRIPDLAVENWLTPSA
ncbi:MAG: type II toxin-antitoxin system VapC family toxin [Candidatus Tectomicrobia bacterium]|nr:type II toxin-antitoxin system VapC family toxin [Candidatus Tectomicrobia bacterium]